MRTNNFRIFIVLLALFLLPMMALAEPSPDENKPTNSQAVPIQAKKFKKRFWQLDARLGALTDAYDRNVGHEWDHKNLQSPNLGLGIQFVTNLSTIRHKFFLGLELNYFKSVDEISKGGGATITTLGLALLANIGFSFRPLWMGNFGMRFSASPILADKIKSKLVSGGFSRNLKLEEDESSIRLLGGIGLTFGFSVFYRVNERSKTYLQYSGFTTVNSQVSGGLLYGF